MRVRVVSELKIQNEAIVKSDPSHDEDVYLFKIHLVVRLDELSKENIPMVEPGKYFECTVSCSSEVRTVSTRSRAWRRTALETDKSCVKGVSSTSWEGPF